METIKYCFYKAFENIKVTVLSFLKLDIHDFLQYDKKKYLLLNGDIQKMRNVKVWIIAAIISISLALSTCSETTQSPTSDSQNSIPKNSDKSLETNELQQIPNLSQSQNTFSIDEIASYSGQPYININNNIPYFSENDLTTESFEYYSDLDKFGRCGIAYASIGIDIMPTEERGNIGQIKPTGWHTVKYNDIIDGNYLYNRCHLIGYQLAGENANEKNIITGTRYLNVQGMLPFENIVTDYVKETGNHVLYRVTPIFEEDNLLASGVLIEAESVEDKGNGILFCVYVYNVQPGITIDYASGESCLDEDIQVAQATQEEPAQFVSETVTQEVTESQVQVEIPSVQKQSPVSNSEPVISSEPEPQVVESEIQTVEPVLEPQSMIYILNTNTMKFHYPSCSSVDDMKEKNKQVFTGNRDDVISQGYIPCKRCNP